MKNGKIKILAAGDSPTQFTGFSEVMRNILGEFVLRGAEVHIWGIGFDGTGYQRFPQFTLFPGREPYHKNLGRFLQILAEGDYTHVWLLNDLNFFSATNFPAQLRQVCAQKKIRSLIYFPVDAALEPDWCEILSRVDMGVAYTKFAVEQVRKADCRIPLEVLPHGVDTGKFKPLPDRKAILKEFVSKPTPNSTRQFADEKDFLILNVNKNEWRKDPFASLQILAELKRIGVPAKMLLRMEPHSGMAGISLEPAGEQLGLKVDEDWVHIQQVAPEFMPQLYNAADLYLTTTRGEGWGLGITEALGCGCPVAMPCHSVMGEIRNELMESGVKAERFVELAAPHWVFGPMDARLRSSVDPYEAAQEIKKHIPLFTLGERPELPPAAKNWLSWPRIGGVMFQLLTGRERA